ncbi:DUF759 family protein (plasmid) [Borrelia coriaceae]|uniref:DUF759 family protein n=1 Tax=Borrelia coriaceae TaxID=144 RepID=UPI00046CAF03|nr:DUF759 family protein [Borrelia coriaceae]UPA16793.1 DUF759 family protein [Borrelia coriaceae]
MNDKFTIKFKGVLDHAATRKSLENDISKLENLIKPKRTSLGSTKDFIKYNLQEKKRELKNQTKYEKLRDKVEKFRLSETKKLIKQGYTFQKAQREAFKRSTMSSEDLRTLEYKKLKEESKRKGKLTQQNKVGIGIPSIAIGTAIGNIVSHAIKKVSSNTLGFAKEAIKEQAIAKRFNLINSRIFEKNEKASLMSNLHGMKTFEQTKSIEEFLSKAGVIKGTLANLGLDNENNVLKSVELAAKLKASGIASSDDDAISSVIELLSGKGNAIFTMMSQFKKVRKDYLEQSQMQYEQGATLDLSSRTKMIEKILKDFNSLNITQHASAADKAVSNIYKLDDELKELTAKVMDPLVKVTADLLAWLKDFKFKTHIVDPLINGIKNIFSLDILIARLKSILPKFLGGDGGESLAKLQEESDKSVSTP